MLALDSLSVLATVMIIIGLASSRVRRAASPWPLLGLMLAQMHFGGFDLTCR